MSSFNNLFRNLNLSKKSQLDPIFRTGGSVCVSIYIMKLSNMCAIHTGRTNVINFVRVSK